MAIFVSYDQRRDIGLKRIGFRLLFAINSPENLKKKKNCAFFGWRGSKLEFILISPREVLRLKRSFKMFALEKNLQASWNSGETITFPSFKWKWFLLETKISCEKNSTTDKTETSHHFLPWQNLFFPHLSPVLVIFPHMQSLKLFVWFSDVFSSWFLHVIPVIFYWILRLLLINSSWTKVFCGAILRMWLNSDTNVVTKASRLTSTRQKYR